MAAQPRSDVLPATRLPVRPLLPGYHPDPTVCRVGGTYVLACSSFEHAPGVPLFRSTDLVTWQPAGHALTRPSQLRLDGVGPSGGIYAPTLRHHDGRFWLVTTNVSDGPGHLLVTADDPAGPWSEPVRIPGAGGIDPDLAWDDDGTCYLTWSDAGIRQAVLDPATGRLLTEPRLLWSGAGGKDVEGPHLHRVDGRWYLLAAEGGTAQGHAVVVARADAPDGPYEGWAGNPVLTARGTASPVQSAGHADLVRRPDGTWAMVFLGVRPAGSFPGWHVLGRETFAVDVAWVDGWPHPTTPVQPAPAPRVVVGLDAAGAGPAWVGAGVFPADVLHRADDGWVLTGPGPRTFVGVRQERTATTTRARVDASGGAGGLELRIDPRHALTLEVDGDRVRALARIGSVTSVLGEAPHTPATVLEIDVHPSPAPVHSREHGPDEVVAAVDGPDGRVVLGTLDGRYLSTEVAGGFTGRTVGLVRERGELTVLAFEHVGHAERGPAQK